ncbi:MAG: translation initiation factor IF-3 [Bacteroidia bacterium]
MNRPPRNFPPRVKEESHRINHLIKATQVRLVQMEDESKNGIYSLSDAMAIAIAMEKDLVEISPNANPPVCKIIEFSKFKYELKKREKEQKANQKASEMKEVRFGPQTDDHDFNFKVRHAEKFLQEGHKVRAYVMFRGRAIVYKNQGEAILNRFVEALEEVGKVEQMPKMEGKKMIIIMVPKASKK